MNKVSSLDKKNIFHDHNEYQYIASPFLGQIVTPIAGYAVAPPASTSER